MVTHLKVEDIHNIMFSHSGFIFDLLKSYSLATTILFLPLHSQPFLQA